MRDELLIQLREWFDEVVDLSEDDRVGFLAAHTAQQPALCQTLERLLAQEKKAVTFLETPVLLKAGLFFRQPEQATIPGSHIGPYLILHELGRGGMGVVYLAERDDEVFSKQVAIKLVWPGLSQTTERFRQERQILADLEHPYIARLLDGGATPEGWQYLVMEYVEGISLKEYCTERKLSITARLNLFLQVCEAVQHAHQNLIIHRDLKPGNILVTPSGQVKLLDFGIAKALETNAQSDLTLPGRHLMTPEYASPEQLTGATITTASDIYSLGVILFEMLTGQRPFQFASRQPHEIARVLSQQVPRRMSEVVKLTRKAAGGMMNAELLRHQQAPEKTNQIYRSAFIIPTSALRGDLDNIVARALQAQPNDRYASVAQFSEDVQRHLKGEVVLARKPTLAYRANRFIRRHKAAFSAGALVILLLVVWLAFLVRQVQQERVQAREQRRALYAAEIKQAYQDWQNNELMQMQKTLERWQSQAGEEDLRGFEWEYLQRLINASSLTLQLPRPAIDAGFLPRTDNFTVMLDTQEVRIFKTSSGKEIMSYPGHTEGWQNKVYVDGKLLRLNNHSQVVIVDLLTGNQQTIFTEAAANIESLAFIAATQSLPPNIITTATDGTIKIREGLTGKVLHELPSRGQALTAYTHTALAETLLTVWDERFVRVNFLRPQRPPLEFTETILIKKISLAENGKYILLLTDEALLVRDVFTGRIIAQQPQGSIAITTFQFLTDGSTLAVGKTDGTIELWAFPSLQKVTTLKGHIREVRWLGKTDDPQSLLSTGLDRTVRWWNLTTRREKAVLSGHTGDITTQNLSPEKGQVITASLDRTVRVWDLHEVAKPVELTGHTNHILTVAYSPDGRHVASGGKDNLAIIHDSFNGAQKILRGHQKYVYVTRFSPDGKWLATGSDDGTAKLWDVATGREIKSYFKGNRQYWDGVRSLVFLPDGQTLVLGINDGTIIVWNIASHQVQTQFKEHPREILSLSLSPDGTLLASGCWEGPFKIWDTTTWQEKAAVNGHQGKVWSAVFSPDGQQLATGSEDQTIKLWDVATMQLLRTLEGHNDGIFQVAFTPDGKRLASVSDDNTVKLWNPQTGQELLTLREHGNEVWGVAFSPNGRTMLTGSWDKTLRLWRAVPK